MSIIDTLPSLTASIQLASAALPDLENIQPPNKGITLLDTKNEIFLAYLQALALRNLEVVRSVRQFTTQPEEAEAEQQASRAMQDEIVKSLVKHRVYLERGVRPLEQKLKYMIDRMVRAADEDEQKTKEKAKIETRTNGHAHAGDADGSSDEDDSDAGSSAELDDEQQRLSYGPSKATFARPGAASQARDAAATDTSGVYRPPRISATAMPTTERRERQERRPNKSNTMDEYINSEFSTAPMAEPSIGSNITEGGRRSKSARERAEEDERREYEETHLTRLPKEGKAEKAKKSNRDRSGFGGEDFRSLGEGLDRIDRLTKRKSGSGGALEKSRKRRATEDGPRGAGNEAGAAFEKRRKKDVRRR